MSRPAPPPDVVIVEADDDIQFGRVVLTPTVARKWMLRNIENNRNKKTMKISGIESDIRAGNFRLTGETIKFNVDGDMVDGQNRVQAFLDSGAKTLVVHVAWNVPLDAFEVMDTGAARTFADTLKAKGLKSERTGQAAVIRRIVLWEAGNPTGVRSLNGKRYLTPTHTQLSRRYSRDAERFDTATARGFDVRNVKLGNSTAAGVAFFLFHEISPGQCHQFFDELISGANLAGTHPAKVLRDRLLRTTDTPNEQLAMYIGAWNAYREDKPLTRLQKPTDAAMTVGRFPRPV